MGGTEKKERFWIRPNIETNCTFKAEDPCTWYDSKKCPHGRVVRHRRDSLKPLDSILNMVGQTPMIKLDRIKKKYVLKCDLYAKCEFFNACGSIKDRIALRMIEEMERQGELTPGYSTLIEPTSGNTGTGLALAAAVKGYRCIIVMPFKMSQEKENVLRALGAEIVRTPNDAGYDEERSHIGQAWKLQKSIPYAVIPDQYRNPGNPLAHYDETAAEILDQTSNDLDLLVAGAGTGGTVAGLGRKIKEVCPKCKVVGVDPYGSILAQPQQLNESEMQRHVEKTGYEIEGTGYDFYPTVLDHTVVDKWVKSLDADGLPMARELIRREGLLCGGSSGASVHAAIQEAKAAGLKKGQKVVVILADSIRNYMTKHLKPSWCIERGLIPDFVPDGCEAWWKDCISKVSSKECMDFDCETDVNEVIKTMRAKRMTNAFITKSGERASVISVSMILERLRKGRNKKGDKVLLSSFMDEKYRPIEHNSHVGLAVRILEANACVVVKGKDGKWERIIEEDDILEYTA